MDTGGPSTAWTGWIGFAAIMMVVIGSINAFEGLIAIIRKSYYTFASSDQLIVFNVKTWGWIILIWGILLVAAGLALAAKSGWARWFTIVVVIINLLAQLGWLGSTPYPVWTLTVIALEIIVLYALTARWSDVSAY